jgi:actin related protein 2/3 complex subunit 3
MFANNAQSISVLTFIVKQFVNCCQPLYFSSFKSQNKTQALKDLDTLANSKFDIPGDAGFPLNSVYTKPSSQREAG